MGFRGVALLFGIACIAFMHGIVTDATCVCSGSDSCSALGNIGSLASCNPTCTDSQICCCTNCGCNSPALCTAGGGQSAPPTSCPACGDGQVCCCQ